MSCEEILCDANNLYKAYLASIHGSKWKPSSQKYSLEYLTYIFKLRDDLITRQLKNGPTFEFQLRERGRVRSITSLCVNDRIVRHALCDDILLPIVRKHIIYDNCASLKGRGLSMQRKRFEIHLKKAYRLYGDEGWILFGDFRKFYDNIVHEVAKEQLLTLVGYDDYLDWLLTLIFSGFELDVSYLSDETYANYRSMIFNKTAYREFIRQHPELCTGEKMLKKSMNIGDQLAQTVGIYYLNPIDTYVKYVRSQKFYGRYQDDFYIMGQSREELVDILENICLIAKSLGIHLNETKTRIVRMSGTFRFLQVKYTIKNGKIFRRISQKRMAAMRRKLKKLAVKVYAGETTYEYVENMFRSWMGSHYKLMSKQQRQNMLAIYEGLFDVKIYINHKKMFITKEDQSWTLNPGFR